MLRPSASGGGPDGPTSCRVLGRQKWYKSTCWLQDPAIKVYKKLVGTKSRLWLPSPRVMRAGSVVHISCLGPGIWCFPGRARGEGGPGEGPRDWGRGVVVGTGGDHQI